LDTAVVWLGSRKRYSVEEEEHSTFLEVSDVNLGQCRNPPVSLSFSSRYSIGLRAGQSGF